MFTYNAQIYSNLSKNKINYRHCITANIERISTDAEKETP